MGARLYEPYINHWIQPDPIVPNYADPQTLNRYSYVVNNPLRYVDPSGHNFWDVVDVIFWAISVYEFVQEPTLANAAFALLDTASLAPIVPSLGYVRHGAKATSLTDEIVEFVARYGDEAYDFARIAHKRGALTLLSKLLSASDEIAQGAARFELEYALEFSDEIVEIGRKLPGGSEIDFVTRGNTYVNVKKFDSTKRFYQMDFGMDTVIGKFVQQAEWYLECGANAVEFVFKGSVPDVVRAALEGIEGVTVKVIP
jgi:hypothetical protein